ncbi:LysR family transcriptional regulator [Georgenia yuyongxinii]|uniref:LysR family transcriptional regulator n=1 Tax=Georgenia yuyongxinii TaxID=2589797 RepID=A0A552WTF8_9MICO|nr:LysR family transcriptional regulator [Georgenia yuyongxinii]TRW46037.1 LysR family transcriptional regulator [Georgenia yuyongxinii]
MDSALEDAASDAELARLASVNLNLLVPLLALLEERSVTRAAATVGLSQPAMSHALRRMRRLLGDELIVRNGSGMTLTPRAVALLLPLRRVLNQAAQIVSPSPFDPAVDSRVISVAMTTSKALVIGSAIARLIAERAPHATLRLRTTTMGSTAQFTEDRADVLLLSEEAPSPYPREHLYDDRWVVITNSSAPRGASALELLATLPHVLFDEPGRSRPYEALDEQKVAYTVRDRVSDNLLIPHLISDAGGVAVHRYRITSVMSSYLDLRIEEFPLPVPSLGIDMVWNPWVTDEAFKDWLRGILVEAAASL